MWSAYDGGSTLGEAGSENGVILADEEHSAGAHITLERDGYTPWAITCGVYGLMVHTVFAGQEGEARSKYAAMKADIGNFMDSDTDPIRWCADFVARFPS